MPRVHPRLPALLALATLTALVGCSNSPYDPRPKMDALRAKTNNAADGKMSFLVFGDAKHSPHFSTVLKYADSLKPDFCITTADLVNNGAGDQGKIDYDKLDKQGGWFLAKYITWPTVGNHELGGGDDGVTNWDAFFNLPDPWYAFDYGNATFVALGWPKTYQDPEKLAWLETTLRDARAKDHHIFVYLHRPYYTVGNKTFEDVEGKPNATTELFEKYGVMAVFSGHDHIYYRTKRGGVNYIISAGAGATIYPLYREHLAVEGDVYYGRDVSTKFAAALAEAGMDDTKRTTALKDIKLPNRYRFHHGDGRPDTTFEDAMYYVVKISIDGDEVAFEMRDAATGDIWDSGVLTAGSPVSDSE
ncbi:MAG: metallophosphoesterase family protein [Planctomycetota bacterium]|jgi:hypothetical protein